ncbi:calcium-dependent channel, putative phosphate domain-containing protein [Hirsutella rhossiliensis]|uniref:Calcium-dependent channel, putative phosphate domain-containing protein n=1 Tax=Hirsutella rhossiliensis TaxID=111463 RepID=A0A9P8SDU9_9HYPO|nr:calcium-dependent channel, putative phosphate domain-containing protein [Hirsutella rhossiliensis]KAH0958339.1 calcium-dependent channel, putative phosphate domain-containing protein [Hirsutella rhossiliensis]
MGALSSQINSNVGNSTTTQDPKTEPQSLREMISSLVIVLAVSSIYLIFFLIFRKSKRRFYAPRTHLGSLQHNERSPDLGAGWFSWLGTFSKLPDAYALTHQGLDAYLFLRFLRVAMIIGLVSICISWPILFPINITGMGTAQQLEILSYSNVDIEKSPNRFYAHCFVGWAVYSFVIYMVMRECIFYINLRQVYLLTPHYARRISSRTVLFTSVPADFLNESKLRHIFNESFRYIWFTGKTDKLDKMVEERDKVAIKLERAEVKLIKMVHKAHSKASSGKCDNTTGRHDHDAETGNVVSRFVPAKKRPSHRLGPLGLVGKKVDTIEWGRAELQRLVPEIEKAQNEWSQGQFDKIGAVFIEFNTQADAEAAYQTITHHKALHMCPKFIGVKPSEVIWKNMSIPWWQLIMRRYAVYGLIATLNIVWAFPVAIIGILEQADTLKSLSGLTWINSIPDVLFGFVIGLLPPILMTVVMSPAAEVMRMCAKLAGAPTLSQAELFTQNAHFVFELTQVLIVQTVSSSAVAATIQVVQNPSAVFPTLGEILPSASNFYISYFILEGLLMAVSELTRVFGLLIFHLSYRFLAGTPRTMYQKWTALSTVRWGSLLPIYTNVVCISLVFSAIAPLVLGWSTIALALFYFAFRYNIIFVSEATVDTQGLIYPRALKQLFAGIYVAETCMIGLFSISKAAGPAALMAVLLIFTILFQTTMFKKIDPLLYGLPCSVLTEEQTIEVNNLEAAVGDGSHGANGKPATLNKAQCSGSGVEKKGNFLMKFFKPWVCADLATLRTMVPAEEDMGFEQVHTNEIEATAYLPPSVTSKTPMLWIPADSAGVSKQEVALTSKVAPTTDEGATIDEKNKINWETDSARPPIWKEKIYY